jgi:hypothetical protein
MPEEQSEMISSKKAHHTRCWQSDNVECVVIMFPSPPFTPPTTSFSKKRDAWRFNCVMEFE